jgi:hypothetical protein
LIYGSLSVKWSFPSAARTLLEISNLQCYYLKNYPVFSRVILFEPLGSIAYEQKSFLKKLTIAFAALLFLNPKYTAAPANATTMTIPRM